MSRSFYYLLPQHQLPEAPRIGQRVTIEGQPGVYIVLRLNTRRFSADLMLTSGNHRIEQNVPYLAIQRLSSGKTRPGVGDPAEAESEPAAT